ncbi:prepilin-type N-terminal cleavage/methylation domain-containing protein [Eubacterium callanderi]|uniref:prepilin-type N-terminal cleavage/methylation domain-containing protein n=2 Tax=Eubacterium callanderi TaxID=53442 RepID=UPI003AF004D1
MMLRKTIKSNVGFTLVELIVTLAVFSIFLVVAGRYVFFGNNLFVTTEVHNSEKFIGDSTFHFMKERLLYAGKIEILKDIDKVEPTYDNAFKLEDLNNNTGQLLFMQNDSVFNNLYGENFYDKNSISYEIKIIGDEINSTSFELTIKVYNKSNEIVYTTSEIIQNLNLALNGNSKLETSGFIDSDKIDGAYINPIISYKALKQSKEPIVAIPTDMKAAYDKTSAILAEVKQKCMDEGIAFSKENVKKYTDFYEYVEKYDNSFSNDQIREYIVKKYYGGQWPVFPGFSDTVLEKYPAIKNYIEYTKKNNIDLRVQCYQGGDWVDSVDNSFVFVAEGNGNSGWKTAFVFDDKNNEWYATTNYHTYQKRTDPINIRGETRETIMEKLKDSTKWTKIEMD